MALVARSATVFVSPSPATLALVLCSRASIASLPFSPALVMKNMASPSSPAPLPYALAMSLMAGSIACTSPLATPTRPCTLAMDFSKSPAIFMPATPAPTTGRVIHLLMLRPMRCMLAPVARHLAAVLAAAASFLAAKAFTAALPRASPASSSATRALSVTYAWPTSCATTYLALPLWRPVLVP